MVGINEYIIEKLRLDKNIKTSDSKLLSNIEDTIISYLENNNWFNTYKDDWQVMTRQDSSNGNNTYIVLKYPETLSVEFLDKKLRRNITEEINSALNIDWYSAINKERNEIEFSDSIV